MPYSYDEAYQATMDYFGGDELATKTFVDKYALKEVDASGETIYHEQTPDDMHHRLAREMAKAEEVYKHNSSMFSDGNTLEDVENIFYSYMKDFGKIIPQGSPMFAVGNIYALSSASNCTVVEPPGDSLPEIFDVAKRMAILYSGRCGVGTHLNNLRPEGMTVKNAAKTSTGAWSFADFYSYVCRLIASSGRRGALMLMMGIRHPDIEKFITMKQDLTKVTGANISAMVFDAFMEAVEADADWECYWPIDAAPKDRQFSKTVRARDLYDLLVTCATKTGEPGIAFWDNYCNNLPAHNYPGFETQATNPCGEVPLSGGDACRLISVNLKGFVSNPFTEKATFDFESFKDSVSIAMRMMDNLVDIEIGLLNRILATKKGDADYPIYEEVWGSLIRSAQTGRRTGLGTNGLADVFIEMGVKYDSDEAVALADRIYRTLRDEAHRTSVNLAKERGTFPIFDWNTHIKSNYTKRLPEDIRESIQKYGIRNISLLTQAPTGSVSIESQTSYGIEPVFDYIFTRRKKINPTDKNARVDFVDKMGDKWQEFLVVQKILRDYLEVHPEVVEDLGDFESAVNKTKWVETVVSRLPECFVCANNIDPFKRVELLGTIQEKIDHGMSSTANLPAGTSIETVSELYMEAWRKGLKGFTVYVDGSRSGVLVSADASKDEGQIQEAYAPKRPEILPCEIHRSIIDGKNWTILVGLLDGVPYEIFGGYTEAVQLPKSVKDGRICKRHRKTENSKGRLSSYDLHVGDLNDPLVIADIVGKFDDDGHSTMTRFVSMSLRHGVPMHFIVEQLQRDAQAQMYSFPKVLARILKKYVQDGSKSSEHCPDCNAKLIFTEGCHICPQCGKSKCS